jgi:hypothetical protein
MQNHLLQSTHFQNWWHLAATPRNNGPGHLKQNFSVTAFAFCVVFKLQNSFMGLLYNASATQSQPLHSYFCHATFLFAFINLM